MACDFVNNETMRGILMKKLMFFSLVICLAFVVREASATVLNLDFQSGVWSNQLGGINDTYTQDGFQIQVASPGNHTEQP